MHGELDAHSLDEALKLLEARLRRLGAPPMGIVVCGGSGLLATGLILRTTKDVDVVALMDLDEQLVDPDPLPQALLRAAAEVAEEMGLDDRWLNNGPSRGDGGLFRLGFPDRFQSRLHKQCFGANLSVYFVDRVDQIHFKLYAAVDRGGRHVEDLRDLHPSKEELHDAARWSMTHDVSEAYRSVLKSMLKQLGHDDVAENV
ncbi:MAG: hypothetical protein AB1486_16110 [Planctomycetota bacterium]